MELNLSSVPFIFLGVIILCGNMFLCSLYFTNRSLRSITNKFVMSLAFCDTIIATVFIPLYIFHTKYGRNYIAAMSSFGSLLNLMALTYERYIAIFHALRYFTIMSKNKVRLLMAEVWSATILVTLFPLPWEMTLSKKEFTQWNRVYGGILTTLVILVTIAVFFIYVKIFKVSTYHAARDRQITSSVVQYSSSLTPSSCTAGFWRESTPSSTLSTDWHNSSLSNRKTEQAQHNVAASAESTDAKSTKPRCGRIWNNLREIKAARIIAVIFMFNFICWLPIIIINICDVISSTGQADYIPNEFLTASLYLFVINSLVNPFIYAFCKRDFRRAIQRRMGFVRTLKKHNEQQQPLGHSAP